ncbi:FGGY family carbohydrate kinase [Hydrotalea sp.]|uniref:FGGY-family carbohydrate kinase n=1 Tax=Hydrotalea sp. TaxID=2881279 RepID=UPI00262D1CD6|nr:FGGY family carbohydrate kinase [Hydrotalea sp.]
MLLPAIAIFDIGKTNKKFFVLDEQYKIIFEESVQLPETKDEDGFACEDVHLLTAWVNELLVKIEGLQDVFISAINFSTYGAGFVHVDSEGKPIAPLYNYLKPFPEKLKADFYNKYGGESVFSQTTASPVLGNLNSGLQLYRLKYEQPILFEKIHKSLHLPQYISSLVTGKNYTDITSIGCHTGLWNFMHNQYHQWLYQEKVIEKLPPIFSSHEIMKTSLNNKIISAGVGLHDSSAALIPYFTGFQEPFILLSTGTWCISFNPFNSSLLTYEELQQDCLCYLTYHGQPVKASRVFAGYEHEQQIKRLAQHYNKNEDYYSTVLCNQEIILKLRNMQQENDYTKNLSVVKQSFFQQRDLSAYATYEEAYHQLMTDITYQQQASTRLVLKGAEVKRIFVDGGFSKNPIYMYLIAAAFPGIEVYAASVAQASATGAALAIHKHWNKKPLPGNIIDLKYYSLTQ